jgi:hypothetical protein
LKPASKFSPYRRTAYLATVAAKHRAIAGRLCDLLESAFSADDISIYSGFPIVVRDMEWIAGFAIRSAGPVAYCCSPRTLAAMGTELKPYMSGKSCVAVKPRKGESIDAVLELVGRAFHEASKHGGMISKADMKKRDALRRRAASTAGAKPTPNAASPTKTSRTTSVKASAKKSSTKKSSTKKSSTKKASTKKLSTKKASTKKASTKKALTRR